MNVVDTSATAINGTELIVIDCRRSSATAVLTLQRVRCGAGLLLVDDETASTTMQIFEQQLVAPPLPFLGSEFDDPPPRFAPFDRSAFPRRHRDVKPHNMPPTPRAPWPVQLRAFGCRS